MAITLMAIKAKQRGGMLAGYNGGKFQDAYNMMHEVNGTYLCFGQIVDTREGRTFYLDGADAAFSDYPSFEAAYHAMYPKQKEADHD